MNKQPRKYDAVLGGKNPSPINAAVLGGIEGVKLRLAAKDELVRVEAVRDAMKYGEAGLDLAIASFKDKSQKVQREALSLLEAKLSHPKVQDILGKEFRLVKNKIIKIYQEEFETVTVNHKREVVSRKRLRSEMFTDRLGEEVELEMVSIPGGIKRINWDAPQKKVNVTGFFMSKHPITQKQYEAVMGKNPSYHTERRFGRNLPVENIDYNDALEFCQRLIHLTGKTYRLPSETEWEYACQADTKTKFCYGSSLPSSIANIRENTYRGSGLPSVYRNHTTNVGSFPPNAFGLYDMHGNVCEWTTTKWKKHSLKDNWLTPEWSSRPKHIKVTKGGCWAIFPEFCCWYSRIPTAEDDRCRNGIRIVLNAN